MEEVGSWATFDPISAIKKQNTDKVRWATEEKGARSWKLRTLFYFHKNQ